MFDQTFVDGVGKTNKGWTVIISALIQFAVIAILVVLPMIFYDVIPGAQLTSTLVAPAPPPPPPPPPPPMQQVKVVKVAPRQFDAGRLVAPKVIPKQVAIIEEAELPPAASDVSVVAGVIGGVGPATGAPGGVLGGVAPPPPPPPPPPPKPVEAPKPVGPQRVSSGVSKGLLVKQVRPNYPPIAKQARVQGVVLLSATIGKDGRIQNLQVVSGPAMLRQAALDAVSQWEYRPYLLNNEPVEVLTEIEVNFALQ